MGRRGMREDLNRSPVLAFLLKSLMFAQAELSKVTAEPQPQREDLETSF
jgi:hypothetical protein